MKNKNQKQEINAASMADVAFLLLIFFMVVTTISQDKGIMQKLPAINPETDQPAHDRNVLEIILAEEDRIMVEKVEISMNQLESLIIKHVTNFAALDAYSISPSQAIISLNTSRGANYNSYLTVQNEIKNAFLKIRNDAALELTNQVRNFTDLSECANENDLCSKQKKQIQNLYAIHFVENQE